jgi:hypothetical protein
MLYGHSRSRINKRRRKNNYTRRFATIYGGHEKLRILRGKYRLTNRTNRTSRTNRTNRTRRRINQGIFKMRFNKTRRRKYKQRH